MIEPLVILTLAGMAGGYLAQYGTLWEMWRAQWENNKSDADEELTAAEEEDVGRRSPRYLRHLARFKWYSLLTCGVCFGWHAIWVTMAVWAGVGSTLGLPVPFTWAEAFPLWLAACAVHTVAFRALVKFGLFND